MHTQSSRKRGRLESGFSLIELMITLAIAAILMTIAVPSFQALIANNTISSDASALVADIALARSEAAKRGTTVSVCASTDSQHCNGTNWAQGRIVFVDSGPPLGTLGFVDPSDYPVLKVTPALNGDTLVSANFPNATYITYTGTGTINGMTNALTGTFTVCKSGYTGRVISISVTGWVSSGNTAALC